MNYEKEKKNRFEQICRKLKDFHAKKEQMKLRGFNDFNFIDLLKGYYDENTHSKIIAEFLNPQGSHYQGMLFLEKFFEVIGIEYPKKDWSVHTEYFVENCTDKGQGRIDIFLDGGEKFVIIENKINAGDQKSQIRKYVECIKKKNKIENPNKILVLYLTLDRNKPSDWSLDGFRVLNNQLLDENDNEVGRIKCINYQDHILKWIEKCMQEIENISNLREAFKQYRKAVEVVTNKEESIMNLKEYLLKDKNREIFADLIENFEEFSKEIDYDKCREIVERENLKQILEEVKYSIREDVAKRIKDQLYNEGFEIADGHEPFGTFAKMAYLIFTRKNLKNGYILYFENQSIYNLKLGKINCNEVYNNILKMKERCKGHGCWQTIKNDKCFSDIRHIDSFNSIGLYKNYIKDDNYHFNSLLAKIKSQLE